MDDTKPLIFPEFLGNLVKEGKLIQRGNVFETPEGDIFELSHDDGKNTSSLTILTMNFKPDLAWLYKLIDMYLFGTHQVSRSTIELSVQCLDITPGK